MCILLSFCIQHYLLTEFYNNKNAGTNCNRFFFVIFFSATAPTVLDYLNSRTASLIDKLPLTNSTQSPTVGSYDYHSTSLPINSPHTSFMYSNWIGLHAKAPSQTNYLLGLQGK